MKLDMCCKMSDEELAEVLSNLTADAALRWDDFSEDDKKHFRYLQGEACRRFIYEHTPLEEPEQEDED